MTLKYPLPIQVNKIVKLTVNNYFLKLIFFILLIGSLSKTFGQIKIKERVEINSDYNLSQNTDNQDSSLFFERLRVQSLAKQTTSSKYILLESKAKIKVTIA